ncbi:hypothetical protein ACH4UV_29895 [Streptomyces sp. NPDC020802]|uniref:hypothetical protein n=1 Tax=Streptomyces sp. NPDC020802 TaxID=3365094 RepID=UPI0037A7A7C3
MTAAESQGPLSVHRLLPSTGEFRTLLLGSSLRKVIRWQISGSDADRPTGLSGSWDGDPRLRKGEFPCGYPGAPVLSGRIAEALRGELSSAGELVPVSVEGAGTDGSDGSDEYFLYLVEPVVDCLDTRRSSKPKRMTGEIKKAVFRSDALPVDLPAFRLPEFRGAVHWNGWAVDHLTELLGDDLEARLIWSEDPSLTPHPDPWGF